MGRCERRGKVLTTAGLVAAILLPHVVRAQARPSGFHLGGSAQAALLVGSNEFLDGGLGAELTGWQGFGSSGRLGARLDLGFVALTDDPDAYSSVRADNTLTYLTVGPTLGLGAGPVFFYARPSLGVAANFQDFTFDGGAGGARVTRSEIDWERALGLAAGLRVFLTRGERAVGMDLAARILDAGNLTFATSGSPDASGQAQENVVALGFSLGLTFRLP